MSLIFHELLHLIFSFSIGFFVWRLYKKPVFSFFAALIGGFFVDVDHFVDYFIAFGTRFNLYYFLEGYHFLKSDKVYVPLHAWEWVIVLFFIAFLIKKRLRLNISLKKLILTILLASALGLFSHLLIDLKLNNMTFADYSILFRLKNDFSLQKLISYD